jgi:hypothetical protein
LQMAGVALLAVSRELRPQTCPPRAFLSSCS